MPKRAAEVVLVSTHADVVKRKSRVRSERYEWADEYCYHYDARAHELVVQVELAGGEWKIARVSIHRLAEDVRKALRVVST